MRSAQDCAEGGLLVVLAECCLLSASGVGAKLEIEAPSIRIDGFLFGESQSRIVVSVKTENLVQLEALISEGGLSSTLLGETGTASLVLSVKGRTRPLVSVSLEAMKDVYENGIARYFEDHRQNT